MENEKRQKENKKMLSPDGMRWTQEQIAGLLTGLERFDRARSKEEAHAAINETLRIIGESTGAERAYIFDRTDKTPETYSNTYEWCADGVQPQMHNLVEYAAADMPVWIGILKNGETVVIDDLEHVREKMPQEYEALRIQDVSSEISVPIFYRDDLSGFIGLDNPTAGQPDWVIQMLRFTGEHLGSVRMNHKMLLDLRRKQESLQSTLRDMEREQQLLKVLCEDCTSVFRVDLMKNAAEPVKIGRNSNAEILLNGASGPSLCYYEEIVRYYDHYIVADSAPDLLRILEPKNLMRELADKERISCRYQTCPNPLGQIYFEVRVTKMSQSAESYQVLVDFRNIDEIVREERQHQQQLESALAASRSSNEIISAISKIYHAFYRIDLKAFDYEEITKENMSLRLTGQRRGANRLMSEASKANIPPEYHAHVERFFNLETLGERLRDEDSVAVEYPVVDGNWHLARFIVETRDEEGNAAQVLCVIRLFSEEKRREKYFISALEEANRANMAKSDFLSRMSHDIRTPMNVILGFANIALEHRDDPEKMRECLEKIRISGGNLQQLINDILDISRIESGELKLTSQPMDVYELFDFYKQTITDVAEQKNLRFEAKIHDIVHRTLLADQVQLGQIYMNLLSNAVKYTPGGGMVGFELYEQALPDGRDVRLVCVVKDTGIGIAPEYMKEMYSAFSRAVDTRVNKVRGSGLGLAIVKKIVDLMNGTIEVESEVQKGTVFRVSIDLPYVREETVPKETEEGETEPGLPSRQLTILVAEDNDLNYEIVAEQMQLYGITCVHAVDGAECVQRFTADPNAFDVILMDMQMPVMNGLEAAAAIRRLPGRKAKQIPIIALTANAYEEDVRRCMEAGMDAHLSKPLDMKKAVRTIAELLRRN